jgi:hypothetical protein
VDINEAISYIFQSGKDELNRVGVVFEVKKNNEIVLVNDPVLNSTKTIYKKLSDVAAQDIKNVYIWGQWGLESLDEIIAKSKSDRVIPHESWTHQFDR